MKSFVRKINALSEECLDLLYPKSIYCICCDKIIDESRPYSLCNECMTGFKWAINRCCEKCGKPLSPMNGLDICFNCRENLHSFRKGYCCCEYGSLEKKLLTKLKFDGASHIAPILAEIICDRMAQLALTESYDCLIPMPSHRSKKLSRGYNQAELISRKLSMLTGIPSSSDCVIRSKKTPALKSLNPGERKVVLRGAFELNPGKLSHIQSKRILIIDDIYTTGASCDELASLLYSASALSVDVFAFASGADMVK